MQNIAFLLQYMALFTFLLQCFGTFCYLMHFYFNFYYQLEKDDIIEDLEVVEQALPSLTSLTNWGEIPSKQQLQRRRGSKSIIERKISVSSIVSDDSFTIGKNYCSIAIYCILLYFIAFHLSLLQFIGIYCILLHVIAIKIIGQKNMGLHYTKFSIYFDFTTQLFMSIGYIYNVE